MDIEMSSSARSGTVNGNGVKGRLKKCMETYEPLRKTALAACVFALAIDPLFLFIPEIDYLKLCIGFDETLRTIVCVLRFLVDFVYAYHIIRYATYLRGQMSVSKRLFYLIVDIVSLLPIPQVVVFDLSTEWSNSLVSKRALKWIIVCQYLPRIIRVYPIYKNVTKTTGTVAVSKWIGAGLNLLLFLLFSYVSLCYCSQCYCFAIRTTSRIVVTNVSIYGQVYGAFWYVSAIEKKSQCWSDAWPINSTSKLPQGNLRKLYCSHLIDKENNTRFLNGSCPLIEPDKITKPSIVLLARIANSSTNSSTEFDFGMYIEVLKSEVGSKSLRDFPKKFFYCFWWGLRNLSTYAQGLIPGNSATDTFFAIIICASGLFLFALLIGNVQKHLELSTDRSKEMIKRKKDTENWMTSRKLPKELQKRIKEYEKNRWRKFIVDEESLLRSLPEDLRLETQRHLDEAYIVYN